MHACNGTLLTPCLQRNLLYVVIVVGTGVAQVIITEFGGRAFSTTGLSATQWAWCLGLGLGSLPWQILIRLLAKTLPTTCCGRSPERADTSRLLQTPSPSPSPTSRSHWTAGACRGGCCLSGVWFCTTVHDVCGLRVQPEFWCGFFALASTAAALPTKT